MSNSRVESHSRAELRNRIISTATLLEILLSGLVLIGLLLSMVPLLQWMPCKRNHTPNICWIFFCPAVWRNGPAWSLSMEKR